MAFIKASEKVGDIVTCPTTGKKGIITHITKDTRYTDGVVGRIVISWTIH